MQNLGFGLGLRTPHYEDVLRLEQDVDFFEVISENFMVEGGKPLYYLDAVAERFPIVLHGVSMSIGSIEPPSRRYLQTLRALADRTRARWVSDHLCWTMSDGFNSHDLLPLPQSREALELLIERVNFVQDVLERPLVLENISTYATLAPHELDEAEFLNALTRATGARLLLDVNNVYVNARNHGSEPEAFLDAIDAHSVQQVHLAGHTDNGDHLIDTHDHPIAPRVYELYDHALRRIGPVSTLIERDDDIPPLQTLIEELDHVRRVGRRHDISIAS